MCEGVMAQTDDDWETIIVPHSGLLNNKDTPVNVRLPINATMSTGALILALVYAIPGFTLVAVSMKAMSFTGFHAGTLIFLLTGTLLIMPAGQLLFKFFRFNTMLSVDRDGYIDHRRSPNKVNFDDIEAFYPIYGVRNFRLEALHVKLKGAEKDQKLSFHLVADHSYAGPAIVTFLKRHGVPVQATRKLS
jgi:hypothetical protein